MRGFTRRDALAAAVTVGAVGIAGCMTGSGDTPESDEEPDSDDNDTDSPQPDDSQNNSESTGDAKVADNGVIDTAIETTEATCGNPSNGSASVSVMDTTVTIDGALGGLSNPCQEAHLGGVEFDDEMLTVDVGTHSTLGPDQACIECVGTVQFVATVELESPISADAVRVTESSSQQG